MNFLWDLYWPVITAAVVIGVVAGRIGFRKDKAVGREAYKRKRSLTVLIATAAVLIIAWVWHGPVGTGERFASSTEQFTRKVLIDWEMAPVQAAVVRSPLKRSLVLSGPADAFQRSELVRILNDVPGVGEVHWADSGSGFALPLLLEVELAALISFGLGLLLAYLLELRRRYNAQWSW
ncbi:hypothetical protein GCM10023264_14290 [Sphingomonas daechungensis]|uniref:hypothetical protein n=1 Tax=Sphingomonas daechungensis TaxID=1176646 RepID=UPI0031EE6AEC